MRRITVAMRILGVAIAVGSMAVWTYGVRQVYSGRSTLGAILAAVREQPLVLFLLVCALSVAAGLVLGAGYIHRLRPWLDPRWVWANRRGEVLLLAAACGFALAILELGSRVLYARQYGLPIGHRIEELVYPPLYTEFSDDTEAAFSVLLLGASVLNGEENSESIERAFDRRCRVYNLSQPAHSSIDSVTKLRYALGRGDRFDYVIFYHGINDVRANNAPPDLFSTDYGHYFFYRLTKAVFSEENPVIRRLLTSSLFYRSYVLSMRLRETRLFGRRFVHIARPREDWLQYGSTIRSKEVFESNLRKIIELCDTYGSHLIVPRYAHHPILDDWAAGRDVALEDGEMVRFTEEWGLPRNVLDGMKAHNEVILSLADRFQYVDTRALEQYGNFVDPCHFTPEASMKFQRALIDALRANEP